MASRDEIAGFVLAGGANRRYGSHKALARIGGRTILDRTLDALAPVVDRVGIVANEPEPYLDTGLPVRPDLLPGRGVLGGILTAVRWASDLGVESAVVLGCDMPFLPSELIGRIARECGPGPGRPSGQRRPAGIRAPVRRLRDRNGRMRSNRPWSGGIGRSSPSSAMSRSAFSNLTKSARSGIRTGCS